MPKKKRAYKAKRVNVKDTRAMVMETGKKDMKMKKAAKARKRNFIANK